MGELKAVPIKSCPSRSYNWAAVEGGCRIWYRWSWDECHSCDVLGWMAGFISADAFLRFLISETTCNTFNWNSTISSLSNVSSEGIIPLKKEECRSGFCLMTLISSSLTGSGFLFFWWFGWVFWTSELPLPSPCSILHLGLFRHHHFQNVRGAVGLGHRPRSCHL